MSIRLLEHLRDELIKSGIVQNTPEFCASWLGRSEGYIRVLRYHAELLSNLVFESFWSCGDLAFWGGFNSVFERDACDDFGEVVKAA